MDYLVTNLERIKKEIMSLSGYENQLKLIALIDETIDITGIYVNNNLALSVFLKEIKNFKKNDFAKMENDKDFTETKNNILKTFTMLNTIR